MRVLLSAFECNPMFGSDPYVGWSWVSNMAKTNDVYVLLRIDHKPYIEKYCAENKIEGYKNIHFTALLITAPLNAPFCQILGENGAKKSPFPFSARLGETGFFISALPCGTAPPDRFGHEA